MFEAATIQKLKQVNVSVNAEKTKKHTAEVWKTASREEQATVLALSNVARSTVQRAYRLGNISAKLIVPIAQTMNVNPLYLSGESDDRGFCTNKALASFLVKLGYHGIISLASESSGGDDASGYPESEAGRVPVVADDEQSLLANLSEDDMVILMKAVILRARAGGASAELARKMKMLLLGIDAE